MSFRKVLQLYHYSLYLTFTGLTWLLPHRLANGLGQVMGRILIPRGRRRRVMRHNLTHAFPELSETQVLRLMGECSAAVSGFAFDAISATRYRPEEFVERFVVEGWEHVEEE